MDVFLLVYITLGLN